MLIPEDCDKSHKHIVISRATTKKTIQISELKNTRKRSRGTHKKWGRHPQEGKKWQIQEWEKKMLDSWLSWFTLANQHKWKWSKYTNWKAEIGRVDKNLNQTTLCLKGSHFKFTDIGRLKVKGWMKKIYQVNTNQKRQD